jgi:hypothetical protein
MHVIGEDRSQRLDVIPAQYRVLVYAPPEIRLPRLPGCTGRVGPLRRLTDASLLIPTISLSHVAAALFNEEMCPGWWSAYFATTTWATSRSVGRPPSISRAGAGA